MTRLITVSKGSFFEGKCLIFSAYVSRGLVADLGVYKLIFNAIATKYLQRLKADKNKADIETKNCYRLRRWSNTCNYVVFLRLLPPGTGLECWSFLEKFISSAQAMIAQLKHFNNSATTQLATVDRNLSWRQQQQQQQEQRQIEV